MGGCQGRRGLLQSLFRARHERVERLMQSHQSPCVSVTIGPRISVSARSQFWSASPPFAAQM
jgi:hypothetical protein